MVDGSKFVWTEALASKWLLLLVPKLTFHNLGESMIAIALLVGSFNREVAVLLDVD